MKKSELRQIIKEEFQKAIEGNWTESEERTPELHRVVTAKDQPPFMTEEEFETKWNKKLGLEEKLVSFDVKEVVKRAKPLFPLLGENQLNKRKLVSDIYKSLKKYSSLPTKV